MPLAAILIALTFAPRPAFADDGATSSRAADLNEAGAKLYRDRDYRRAIEKFIEAYAIDHDPNLLFNMARCYEELGDSSAAIEKYTAYIKAPGADAAGRLRAEQSLRALQEIQKHAAADATAKSAPARAGLDAAPAGTEPTNDAAAPGSSSRVVAWTALGAGVLAAGLGGVSFYLGARDHARVTRSHGYGDPSVANPLTLAEARELAAAGDTKKLAGGIALGVGGALLATSALLFVLGGGSETAEPTTSVALGWTPGTPGFRASWTVRF